nr:uncharacterized protein CTRU02_10919 [Colletotrichum truncatum]KAF6786421.1 hypothetical protein CTRU02_10919 [Colletotrichum truncatum]
MLPDGRVYLAAQLTPNNFGPMVFAPGPLSRPFSTQASQTTQISAVPAHNTGQSTVGGANGGVTAFGAPVGSVSGVVGTNAPQEANDTDNNDSNNNNSATNVSDSAKDTGRQPQSGFTLQYPSMSLEEAQARAREDAP